jgi:predicted  nucleic acid-binding Zn-ribbon protein
MSNADAPTQPLLSEILDAVNGLGVELHQFRAEANKRFEKLEIRLDRIDGEVKFVHSEILNLRADMKELRAEFNEFRSQFKQPA